MEEQILERINKIIRREHGNRVTLDSLFKDAELDSLATTIFFMDLDEAFHCFSSVWFDTIDHEKWQQLSIREIIQKVIDESSKLQGNLTK
jgi:hypothetical protein